MKRFIQIFTAIAGISCMVWACQPKDNYVKITGFAQGGTYSVTANMKGVQGMIKMTPQELKENIDSILLSVDNSLSGYNKSSELTQFNEGKIIKPSLIFKDIYRKSYNIYIQTDSIVDVASAPLFDAWGFGFKSGEMPTDEIVDSLKSSCGLKYLHKDIDSRLLSDGSLIPSALLKNLEQEIEPSLNFNSVAQGYSCDIVVDYLKRLGIKDMMVDIGEIFCQGLNSKGKNWTIAIDTPSDNNNNPGADICGIFIAPKTPCGIVTSGNYRKFYVRDGKKYAHTIDPRTGRPVEHNLLSATVIAKDGFTADALATYCMVVGLDESMNFIENNKDVEACLVYSENGEFHTWQSSGFVMRK